MQHEIGNKNPSLTFQRERDCVYSYDRLTVNLRNLLNEYYKVYNEENFK